LNELLSDYEKQSTVELVGMIVTSLNGQDIFDYSMKICNENRFGKSYVNNGGLILIAIQEKQVRINLGYGLEWPVDDVKASLIIEEMIPFLRNGNYFKALDLGLNKLIKMTSKYDWMIENKNIDLLADTDIGKIFSFKATFIKDIYETPKLNADGSFEIKLSPFNQIIVRLNNQREVTINATLHMGWLVEKIKGNETSNVIARLKEFEPVTFELLGVSVSARPHRY
jgi:hypothetical protein